MISLTHEQVAQRAYEIHLRNGHQPGRDLENWLQAEAELKQELACPTSSSVATSVKPVITPPIETRMKLPPRRKTTKRVKRL